MVHDGDCVAIFNSIHRVMKAEKILKEQGMPILLIPAPRALNADCGLALRYVLADRPRVEMQLAEAGLVAEEIYEKRAGGYVRLDARPGEAPDA
ncbi:hypothetical protein GURASL_06940 [Geotalea uraniireducens]|uniref:Putative Se/S carrier protein-like domain-containing protein n=1 Tax=Geotalea uraniireducens TaxID=351604 RepID=A0ABN6VSH6_9BACT|nr:DUF3343 domain-containing protein [Geotalea uraniireducens]BDV41771.1 hypothetical protein GURASL_06940 [Geotalea uraniireducens]